MSTILAPLFELAQPAGQAGTITVGLSELHTLLQRGAKHVLATRAGRATGYLWLWTTGGQLVAVATDRHGLAQADTRAIGDLPPVGIRHAALKQLLAELKAARAGWVTLAIAADHLTVVGEDSPAILGAAPVVEPDLRDLDALRHLVGLLQRYSTGEDVPWTRGRMAVDPRLLAKWGDAGVPVRVWPRSEWTTYIEVDEHWRGLLMLMRAGGGKIAEHPLPALGIPEGE